MPNQSTASLPQAKAKERILWMDALAAAAAFCVVLLHANIMGLFMYPSGALFHTFFVVISSWAAPVFFMLSGAKLMGYRERYSTKAYFAKRLKKTVFPWFCWSVIIFVFIIVMAGDLSVLLHPAAMAMRFFSGLVGIRGNWLMSIYWFFVPLFGVYLCIPLVSLLKERRRLLWCMAGAFLVLGTIFTLLRSWLPFSYSNDLRLPISGYLAYAILGHLLVDAKISRATRIAFYWLGLFGIILSYGLFILILIYSGDPSRAVTYVNPPVALISIGVFILFRETDWERLFHSQQSISVLQQAAACGLGIYLIHFFLMQAVAFIAPGSYKLPWSIVTATFLFSAAALLIGAARKVPLLRAIVP